MADSNRVQLAFAEEVTFATDPAANYDILRITSESLSQETSFSSSDEINSRRTVQQLDRTDRGVTGNIAANCYFGVAGNDGVSAFMRYAMGSGAFDNSGAVTTIISGVSCNVTQSSKTIALASGSFAADPSVGDWIYISGSANSATNGWHKIATVDTTAPDGLTVETAIGADESGVSLTIVKGDAITDGTTLTTLSMQRKYSDLSNQAAIFTGCAVNSWTLTAEGNDVITNSFDIVGYQETSRTSSAHSATAGSELNSMTAIDGVQFVRENGVGIDATGFSFTVTNNIRKRYKLGTFGPDAFKQGDFVVTGTLQAYFASEALFDKYLNNTATSLSLCVSDEVDSRGNAFVFDFPNVEFTSGQRVAGGRNQDIIADLSWQAIYDSTDNYNMKMAVFPSA